MQPKKKIKLPRVAKPHVVKGPSFKDLLKSFNALQATKREKNEHTEKEIDPPHVVKEPTLREVLDSINALRATVDEQGKQIELISQKVVLTEVERKEVERVESVYEIYLNSNRKERNLLSRQTLGWPDDERKRFKRKIEHMKYEQKKRAKNTNDK